jgi:hypothetical protein
LTTFPSPQATFVAGLGLVRVLFTKFEDEEDEDDHDYLAGIPGII